MISVYGTSKFQDSVLLTMHNLVFDQIVNLVFDKSFKFKRNFSLILVHHRMT